MTIEDLKQYDLVYLGTPYSKYPDGTEEAFIQACRHTARLLRLGVKVYSPIAHTHPVAVHGGIDPLDLSIWLPFDAAMIAKSDAMVVAACMEGWRESVGLAHEIAAFKEAAKPVWYMGPQYFDLAPPPE